jgi:hypothetical protein
VADGPPVDPDELEMERAVIALTWRPRRLPYGYQLAHRGLRVPVVDPKTAPIVQFIFQELIRHGSIAQLVRDLNRFGHRAPRGGRWSRTTVRDILTNPAYHGRPRGVPLTPQKACVPIVTTAEFLDAQRILRGRRRTSPRRPMIAYPPVPARSIPCP